jgi:hypothetical protein
LTGKKSVMRERVCVLLLDMIRYQWKFYFDFDGMF